MKLEFSGAHALIAGGTCEMGLCLARLMIRSNIFPILTYRRQKALSRISDKMSGFNGQYATALLKFDDTASLTALFSEINHDLDFMVDFAQGHFEGFVASADLKDVSSYFDQNVAFRADMIKQAARVMLKKKQGRLIFVSSAAAGLPNPGQGFYAAAKLASEALYKNLGIELGSRGITSVILRPGYIASGRGKAYISSHEKEVLSRVPIKRALSAQEVAEVIMFFLSKSAAGFNGAIIALDGGLTICK